jgi:RsiW-degrading membrane proteinase PrsW (M82 family)
MDIDGLPSPGDTTGDASTAGGEDERATLARLLGPNAEAFLRVYDRRLATGRRWPISWCWSGLFLTSFWTLYRRLYGFTVIAGLVTVLADAALAATSSMPPIAHIVVTTAPTILVALFGRALVVDQTLHRMHHVQAKTAIAGEPGIEILPSGPLRGLAAMLVTTVVLAVIFSLCLALVRGGVAPAWPHTVSPEAPFTGMPTVDRPLAMLLANGIVLSVIAAGCRHLARQQRCWPGLAAVAVGSLAALIAATPPIVPTMLAMLPSDPALRLLAVNYLLVGPLEEAVKLGLLLVLVLRWEPARDPKTAMIAAFLVGAGFALTENLAYAQTPVHVVGTMLGRLLLPIHLLLASITALGVYGFLRTGGRRWPTGVAWLGAVLAHAAFNHSVLTIQFGLFPYDEFQAKAFRRLFGVDPAALRGMTPWPEFLEAALAALMMVTASCAVGWLLRDRQGTASTAGFRPDLGSASTASLSGLGGDLFPRPSAQASSVPAP